MNLELLLVQMLAKMKYKVLMLVVMINKIMESKDVMCPSFNNWGQCCVKTKLATRLSWEKRN